jgi:2-polyprenyl-3-methyl-5-hydroxy-6-metoxy-1,4-benzoquinol methylase
MPPTWRGEYHLDVRVGTLEQASFPSNFFDVVTLWDVLEHLHDPAESLYEIHRFLRKWIFLCGFRTK